MGGRGLGGFEGGGEEGELFGGEVDVACAEVFFEVLGGGCAGDEDDVGRAVEEPSEGEGGWGGLESGGEGGELGVGSERCFFREGFCCERTPRKEGDTEGVAMVDERIVSGFKDVVPVLNGSDFCDGSGLFELFNRDIGQADVADESFVLKLFQCADAFLKRDVGVGSVKLVEVDLRDAEPAQAFFAPAFEGGGTSVGQDAIGRGFFDAALGGDERARG